MILVLTLIALAVALLVTMVTCIQLLYLESLRVRTKELPALQFFREKLEPRIGLETERGALTFSLVKHIGLGFLGCLIVAITAQNSPLWEALAGAFLLTGLATVLGAHIVPQVVYRKTTGQGLAVLVPVFRILSLIARPLTWGVEFLQSLFDLGRSAPGEETPAEEHIDALISAGEEEGIIEKGDRELIQSVVAFGDKTVREVLTPRPNVIAISQDATLDQLRELAINEQYSRIPAFDGDIDSITGFVHVRDMFELDEEERAKRKVRDILRPIRMVPETKPVNDL